MRDKRAFLAGLMLFALVAASCGGGENSDGGGGTAAGGGGGGGFSISSPEDGADVPSSFTLEVSSDETLGPPESGEHHVHVFYDGNSDKYTVVESSTFEVSGLDPGEHTVTASLRNADHSAAGPEDEITVTVGSGAGGGGGNGGDDGDDDGGYRY
jgi:hypothetical protein